MKYSVILPVYNEEKNLHKGTIDRVLAFFKKEDIPFELIIVDDGSTDKTVKLIQKDYGKNNHLKLIEQPHEGKAYSVIKGIKEAKGDVVFFSDFDLATPIEEFHKLRVEIEKGYDIAIGSRKGVRRGAPLTRKILSKGMMVIRDWIIGLHGIRDTQCGFKMFKKKAAEDIITKFKVFNSGKTIVGPSVSAAFDLEFLFIAKKMGYSIKEVPVEWRHVETRNVNFIRDAYESMKDIMRIKYYALTGQYT